MDIIYLCVAPPKRRALMRSVCDASHTRFFGEGERSWVDWDGSPATLPLALKGALGDDRLDDACILSHDTTVVLRAMDLSRPRCARRSLWLRRKGLEQDAMVRTLRWLMEGGCSSRDYEVRCPQLISRRELLRTIAMMDGSPTMLLRTMHFNRLPSDPLPIEDPTLQVWTWNHVPEAECMNLSDACFRHEDCIRYLLANRP